MILAPGELFARRTLELVCAPATFRSTLSGLFAPTDRARLLSATLGSFLGGLPCFAVSRLQLPSQLQPELLPNDAQIYRW